MTSKRQSTKIILTSFIAIIFSVMIFYWIESRKEIKFLCGNFSKGVSELSVRQQLDTGNLLRYFTESSPYGSRIIVDSAYSLSMYKCVIDLDEKGIVIQSKFEQ